VTFLNSILNGNTLIRPAMQSPNYITGVSGWSINADGSAEFGNTVVRGTIATGTTSVQRVQMDSSGSFPTIWFFSNATAPGSDVPFINSPGAGIGVNTQIWGFTDSTPVRTRLFLYPSNTGTMQIERDSDGAQYGGYTFIDTIRAKSGIQIAGQTAEGYMLAQQTKVEITCIASSGNTATAYVDNSPKFFAQSGTWAASDATVVRTRVNSAVSGGDFQVTRDSDGARYGGYYVLDQTGIEAGFSRNAANPRNWIKAVSTANNKSEMTAVDAAGNTQQVFVDSTQAKITTANALPFNIDLGSGGNLQALGKNANMSTQANGMFLHGENGFTAATVDSLVYGATMASQVDNVITNEAAICQWVQTASPLTGFTMQQSVSQVATINWVGLRR
jgi:hypothetical protein